MKKPSLCDLENKMYRAKTDLSVNSTLENHQKYIKTKLDLEVAWEHETKGAMIRSKERWIQEGEKSTKYFLNLEKRNVVNKTITSLKTNDGNVITNQEELLKEQVTYYKALYKRDSKVSSNEYEHFKESITKVNRRRKNVM